MSPNEFQLRAALHDGEGKRVDPDTVMARARGMQQARHDRRVRYASVAAVVAVVAGIGVVGGIAVNGGGHHNTAAGGVGDNAAVAPGQNRGAKVPQPAVAAPGPLRDAQSVACPAAAPTLKTPAGAGGTTRGQFGAAGSLFSGAVESIKICAYAELGGVAIPAADGTPVNTVLTGQRATAFAASLDAAPKQRTGDLCPLYLLSDGKTLVIIGVSTTGQAMKPITATVHQNPCNRPVTNGTAIRYNWSPPSSLNSFLTSLPNTGVSPAPHITPSGKNIGSPIRS
jgi:hypothetical protein